MSYTITTNHNGSIEVSTIHKGIRRHRTYYEYTQQQAESLFYQWILTLG